MVLRWSHSLILASKDCIESGSVGWMSEDYQETPYPSTGTGVWEARINRRLNTGIQYDYATSLDYSMA